MPSSQTHKNHTVRLLLAGLILLVLGIIFWRYDSDHPAPGALPHLNLRTLSGNMIDLRNLKGKPVVLNLWATWCHPCRAELPLLMRANKNNPGIRFYFVEQGDPASAVAAFAKSIGLAPGMILLDRDTKLSKFFGTIGYPTTIFYNSNGNIVRIHRGKLSPQSLKENLLEIQRKHPKALS